MARELVALKVKIGTRPNGHADHPDFSLLQVIRDSGVDWSTWIDTNGTGWLYDDVGHKEVRAKGDVDFDSPHGQQWGMLLVPVEFANQAAVTFPQEVSVMDETTCERFYNECHAVNQPEEKVDEEALKIFEAKTRNGVTLTESEDINRLKALDPNDPTPGITKNPRKTWADFKGHVDIVIKPRI